MNITNKYVKIQIGDKQVEKKNFFLNKYLKAFSKGQLSEEYSGYNIEKNLGKDLYIKLDEPLQNIDYDSELDSEDFELHIELGKGNFIQEQNEITAIYTFTTGASFIYNGDESTSRSVLNGHKIVGLSFSLMTYLDVSEYDIYFVNDEIMTIVKEDYISSDAYCDGYDYPYHLSPKLEYIDYESAGGIYQGLINARIYSVGLGKSRGVIEEEYVVGQDIDILEEDDTTFSFILKKEEDKGIYPGSNIYPSATTLPKAAKKRKLIYPNNNIYSSSNMYPLLQNYDYIIIKYMFYYINRGSQVINLNKYYTMSYYSNKSGILTIKNKIERN